MEKYLVIILLILLMYTVYQCWKLATVTTEGFADASVPTNVDTNNSIATLAQLATDLQSGGGLKVPGNLNVQGVQTLTNDKWHISGDGQQRTFYGNKGRTYFGTGNGYSFRNSKDNSNTKDIVSIADDGQMYTTGTIHAHTDGFNTRLGAVWTAPGVFAEDGKNLELGAGSSNVYIGSANGNGNNNLIVTGTLQIGSITLSDVGGNLVISKPIADPQITGYPSFKANSIGDAYFSFMRRDGKRGAAMGISGDGYYSGS